MKKTLDQRIHTLSAWAEQKKLTFGFELEGMFRAGKLDNVSGDFKTDGSVDHGSATNAQNVTKYSHEVEDDDNYYWWADCSSYKSASCDEYDDGSDASEFASTVYTDFAEAIGEMSEFNDSTYAYNHSCGLHFHVGSLNPKTLKSLECLLTDFDFQSKLHKMAKTKMGKVQKYRTERNASYCHFWDTAEDLRRERVEPNKYRFMNFHGETIEFRFLSPCQQKIENVVMLMEALQKQLDRPHVIGVIAKAVVEPKTKVVKSETVQLKDSKYLRGRNGTLLRGAYARMLVCGWTPEEMAHVVDDFDRYQKMGMANAGFMEYMLSNVYRHGASPEDVGLLLDIKELGLLEQVNFKSN